MAKTEIVLDGKITVRQALALISGSADDFIVRIKVTAGDRSSTYTRKAGDLRTLPASMADRLLQEALDLALRPLKVTSTKKSAAYRRKLEKARIPMESTKGMLVYCLKCRAKRRMIAPQFLRAKNGKPMTQGICPVCGTKMFRIGKGHPGEAETGNIEAGLYFEESSANRLMGRMALPERGLGETLHTEIFVGQPRAMENMVLPRITREPETQAVVQEPLRAYPRLEAPDCVKPKEQFCFKIGLSPQPFRGTVGDFMVIPTQEKEFDLDVRVIAHDFLAPEGTRRYLHVLRNDIQANVATIKLIAPAKPSPEGIDLEVEYSYEGNLIGRAWRKVRVVPGNAPIPAGKLPEGKTAFFPVSPEATPDLTVTISDVPDGTKLEWNFYTPFQCKIPGKKVRTRFTERKAENFAAENIQTISNYTGNKFLDNQIKNTAQTISDYMPPEFWQVLNQVWEAVKKKDEKQVPAVLIISSDPYIPWELASTKAANLDQTLVDHAFPPVLGAQVKVGRWIPEGPKNISGSALLPDTKIEIKNMAVIIGKYKSGTGIARLPEAQEEGEDLEKSYQAIDVGGTVNNLDALLDDKYPVKDSPEPSQILHFACHGAVNPGTPDSGIVLNDGTRLTGMILKNRDLFKNHHPLVFMNACDLGFCVSTLTGYGGMAGDCVSGGCMGFIGPLWSVNDKIAREFAVNFYQAAINNDIEVSEVIRRLRAKFSVDAQIPESTYLAYIFYGHPKLVLTRT
jgi:hypothetical protein